MEIAFNAKYATEVNWHWCDYNTRRNNSCQPPHLVQIWSVATKRQQTNKSIIWHLSHLCLLPVFWRQQFLVGRGPFVSGPTGCWPAIFSCFPCHWSKTSRSSPCGCVPFSAASIPVCLKATTRKLILRFITIYNKTWLASGELLFSLGQSS